MDKIIEKIKEIMSRSFYGRLTIWFEGGKFSHFEITETFKPDKK